METQELETIETPVAKHKVEIKKYLTGRDRRALRAVYLDKSEVKLGKEKPEFALSGKIVEEAENKAIEIVVIAIDGNKENILNTILDMRDKDYEFVMQKINQITSEKKTE